MSRKSPRDGGCRFCHDDSDPLVFCHEFDCNLHMECFDRVYTDDPGDPELAIMYGEFYERKIIIPDQEERENDE